MLNHLYKLFLDGEITTSLLVTLVALMIVEFRKLFTFRSYAP